MNKLPSLGYHQYPAGTLFYSNITAPAAPAAPAAAAGSAAVAEVRTERCPAAPKEHMRPKKTQGVPRQRSNEGAKTAAGFIGARVQTKHIHIDGGVFATKRQHG